ncbi:terminase small subunit [Sinorhizobium chiapasense]|uniref:Terminase small subunit n=1 Tax=Sinorhizobium chiapasense TaxID=501572 RepID=A0ABZ2BA97_9HYPH
MDALSPRQEAFCRHLAEGRSQRQAYIEAGYSARGDTADEAASRLAGNIKVAFRLAELQAQQAKRLDLTVEKLVLELEDARLSAMADRNYAVAIVATMAKAKLLGFIVPGGRGIRREPPGPVPKPYPIDPETSLAEWKARFCPKVA